MGKKKKVAAKYSNLTQTPCISDHFPGWANYIQASEVSLEDRKKPKQTKQLQTTYFFMNRIFLLS